MPARRPLQRRDRSRNPDGRADVIIVGGGPAGLSAALFLGRCRRRVVVIDAGRPRNRLATQVHGYLTRDGSEPLSLLRAGRAELRRYGVRFIRGHVTRARCVPGGFTVGLADRRIIRGRKLLLATGVVDQLPAIDGLAALYGRSVHHCPYCDGWEWRDRPLAAYGKGRHGAGLALSLTTWSRDVVLLTDGPARFGANERAALERQSVIIDARRITRMEGERGLLKRVVFDDGPPLRRSAMFFNTGQFQRSALPAMLGCSFDRDGGVRVDRRQRSGIAGLYVAGDALRDVQFVVAAAAHGATAALAINHELQNEEGRGL